MKITPTASKQLSELEGAIEELSDKDAEFIGRMTQDELDDEPVSQFEITRIARLHAEHCS